MPADRPHPVLDTNILVRGLIKNQSPSGLILHACEQRRLVPLLSLSLLAEYRITLNDADLVAAYPQIEENGVNAVLERLAYVGDIIHPVRARFALPRDPKDSKLIELAIAGEATHLITLDRDILDLLHGTDATARHFRHRIRATQVLKPDEFLARLRHLFDE